VDDVVLDILGSPAFSGLILTVVTGIFSVIMVKMKNTNQNVIKKVSEHQVIVDKEKNIRQRLSQAEKERHQILDHIYMFQLKISMVLVRNIVDFDSRILEDLIATSGELEGSYRRASEEVKKISMEYDVMVSLSNEFQADFDHILEKTKNKKNESK